MASPRTNRRATTLRRMRAAGLLVTPLLLASGVARAEGAQNAQVSLDWSRVSDADVARCGLSRLRAGTLERLVADGHAVVDAVDARGVEVRVASVPAGLSVVVTSGDVERAQTLEAPPDCDATLVLDVISRIAELVGEVARARPPPAPTSATESRSEPAPAPTAAPSSSRLLGAGGVVLRVSEAGSTTLGATFGGRMRWPGGLEAGVLGELSAGGGRNVDVLEALLVATCAWQPSASGLGVHLELGPLLHAGSSDVRSITELDAVAAAGLQLVVGPLFAHVLAQGRLRRFDHRVDGQKAFDTGHLGLLLRVGGQLSGP